MVKKITNVIWFRIGGGMGVTGEGGGATGCMGFLWVMRVVLHGCSELASDKVKVGGQSGFVD